MTGHETLNHPAQFRSFQLKDAGKIAKYFNANIQQENPLWCSENGPISPTWIRLHAASLKLRGTPLTQVHEHGNEFISYFAGYRKGTSVTFTMAVVNLDLPSPMEIFKSDASRILQTTLHLGTQDFKLRGSSDKALYAPWIEQEVGFKKYKDKPIWNGNAEIVKRYLSERLQSGVYHSPTSSILANKII